MMAMFERLQVISRGANRFLTGITLAIFIFMIVVVGVQMLARWVLGPLFGAYLSWTASLSRVLLVCITFVGAGIASRDREHVTLNLVIKYLSPRGKQILFIGQFLIIGAFLILLISGAVAMYDLTAGRAFGALPTYPLLSNGWLYIYAIIGSLLMFLYTLRDAASVMSDKESSVLTRTSK